MSHPIDVILPSDREISVRRVFDAPRSVIFDCHTRPDLVRRWMLGPPGWTMPVCEIDFRVGGEYRHVWRSEDDGSEFGFRGDYLEIDAPARIVHAERFDGTERSEDGDAICTLTLTESDGRTTLTHSMRFPTREIRDQALESGMTDGMAAGYERIDALVEAQPVAPR